MDCIDLISSDIDDRSNLAHNYLEQLPGTIQKLNRLESLNISFKLSALLESNLKLLELVENRSEHSVDIEHRSLEESAKTVAQYVDIDKLKNFYSLNRMTRADLDTRKYVS